MKSNLFRNLFNLHNDEDGMEAIQVVALVAIGALILIVLKTQLWPKVEKYAGDEVRDLINKK